MLGSNQRPLPCESRSITSWLFAGVQKDLQNRAFVGRGIRVCSPLFVWVGVLLVYIVLYHRNAKARAPVCELWPLETSDCTRT
jgi:hypothetical protein